MKGSSAAAAAAGSARSLAARGFKAVPWRHQGSPGGGGGQRPAAVAPGSGRTLSRLRDEIDATIRAAEPPIRPSPRYARWLGDLARRLNISVEDLVERYQLQAVADHAATRGRRLPPAAGEVEDFLAADAEFESRAAPEDQWLAGLLEPCENTLLRGDDGKPFLAGVPVSGPEPPGGAGDAAEPPTAVSAEFAFREKVLEAAERSSEEGVDVPAPEVPPWFAQFQTEEQALQRGAAAAATAPAPAAAAASAAGPPALIETPYSTRPRDVAALLATAAAADQYVDDSCPELAFLAEWLPLDRRKGALREAAMRDRVMHIRREMMRDQVPQICIVGGPNVGKSTLLNALAGAQTAVTSPAPHTTYDPVLTEAVLAGRPVRLVDTAGLGAKWRRTARDEDAAAVTAAVLRCMRESDVVVVVVDGAQLTPYKRPLRALSNTELDLASLAAETLGKVTVLAVNKWDTVPSDQRVRARNHLMDTLEYYKSFAQALPVVFMAVGAAAGGGGAAAGGAAAGGVVADGGAVGGWQIDECGEEALHPLCPARGHSNALGKNSWPGEPSAAEREEAGDAVSTAAGGSGHIAALRGGSGLPAAASGGPAAAALGAAAGGAAAAVAVLSRRIFESLERWGSRVPMAKLNRWLAAFQRQHPPPWQHGSRLYLERMHQMQICPPLFVLWTQTFGVLPHNYKTFMSRQLAHEFGFYGTPIRILVRSSKPPPQRKRAVRRQWEKQRLLFKRGKPEYVNAEPRTLSSRCDLTY